jgi:hypothetical protein
LFALQGIYVYHFFIGIVLRFHLEESMAKKAAKKKAVKKVAKKKVAKKKVAKK